MLLFVDQDPNPEETRYNKMQKDRSENPSPSFNANELDLTTPEMKPGPYFPGQGLMRDKYIREEPGSGVT